MECGVVSELNAKKLKHHSEGELVKDPYCYCGADRTNKGHIVGLEDPP